MSRQAIGGGFPFGPIYINETSTRQAITGPVYSNETVLALILRHFLSILGVGA